MAMASRCVRQIFALGCWVRFGERGFLPILIRRQGWLAAGRRSVAGGGLRFCSWFSPGVSGVGSALLRATGLVFARLASLATALSWGLGLACRPTACSPGFPPSSWLIWGHTSPHRSLQTTVLRATMGFTCSLAQCIPEPLSRASTSSLLALSTARCRWGTH